VPTPSRLPLVVHEDDHLLVVNKPAGLNTHSPSPFSGEGVYDWLRHREPRWSSLAIIHRLDKETSGVLVFGKTPVANRTLTQQFTEGSIRKKYLLMTDRPVQHGQFTVKSALVRTGEKYVSRPEYAGAVRAITHFRVRMEREGLTVVNAEPVTGRTHQIRVQAAERGFPILGDTLYGGTPAARLCLHAEELTLKHPATGTETTFRTPADFPRDPASPQLRQSALARIPLREGLIEPALTDAYRLLHGASDGWPGWYVDRLGQFLLSQSAQPLTGEQQEFLEKLLALTATPHATRNTPPGAYHKLLTRNTRHTAATESSPHQILGETAPDRFHVRENGAQFELSFREGYSVGLFLDQRDNRRRFLINHVAANFPVFLNGPAGAEVLNTFAYTCGFSVCAAMAGARTTSIDLSKKYLEWGKRNFTANQCNPAEHEFIYGDTFEWLRRLAKKGRQFDVIVLDPPTFSRSKEHGSFQVERDYSKLVLASLPLLRSGGVLFASTNAATWEAEEFLATVKAAAQSSRRKILQQHYVPQPPDFPISRLEPAYLKTVWMRLE